MMITQAPVTLGPNESSLLYVVEKIMQKSATMIWKMIISPNWICDVIFFLFLKKLCASKCETQG